MQIHELVRIHIQIQIHIHIKIQIQIHVHINIQIHLHGHLHVHVHAHARVRTYTDILGLIVSWGSQGEIFRKPVQAPPLCRETRAVKGRYDSANPSKHHHRYEGRQEESRGDTAPGTRPSNTAMKRDKGSQGGTHFREPVQAPPL